MKIGIITFHFVNNYGGLLQSYALWRAVSEKCGVECEVIDYHNWFIRFTDAIRLFPITTNIHELMSGLMSMKQRLGRVKKFNKFVHEYFMLSPRYFSHFKINRHPPNDDKFICGSDQIWNPFLTAGVSLNYFLGFESKPENKIAYAPSFGTNEIPGYYKTKMKNYINSIKYLSVREKSGQELIKLMTGRKVERLIDPTFILRKEEWEDLGKAPEERGSYVLLYVMQRDEKVYHYAQKIKKQLGIKIIEISRYGYKPDFIDEVIIDVGPREFLGLFRDASYICTNSYHGLAFSVIFEKEFCLIPCKRFKGRIDNLLDMFHIKITKTSEEIGGADYNKQFVRNVIEEEREKAIRYLKDSIGIPDNN